MAKTTVELPESLHRKLRVMAALENRSMNDIVVTAVKDYLHDFRFDMGILEPEARSHEQNGGRGEKQDVAVHRAE